MIDNYICNFNAENPERPWSVCNMFIEISATKHKDSRQEFESKIGATYCNLHGPARKERESETRPHIELAGEVSQVGRE